MQYLYECPSHGRVVVEKPMAEARRLEYCTECSLEAVYLGCEYVAPLRRIFTPPGFIMRPSGYNLRPGDKGYSNFSRERELGELRDPGDADLHGRVEEPEEAPFEMPKIAEAQMQKIHEMGRVIDRQVREEMVLPQKILDMVGR